MTICNRTRRPTPPGEILSELYLAPRGVSIAKFAEAVGVTRKHMSAIINGRASITAETAARIATVLGTTAQYWLNLQNAVDLYDAQERLREAVRQPQPMPIFAAEAALGINTDHTLEEGGRQFSVTRERVRQIEAKALRKLKHPSRSRKLRSILAT